MVCEISFPDQWWHSKLTISECQRKILLSVVFIAQISYYGKFKAFHNLTLSWRRPLSYRIQSIDLQSKSNGFHMITTSVMKGLIAITLQLVRSTVIMTRNKFITKWNLAHVFMMVLEVISQKSAKIHLGGFFLSHF